MWSMPLTPHMSPAAIGCSEVMPRGWPLASKRRPMASSTASGQPRPLDELTVITEPSAMRAAASSAETIRGMAVSLRPPAAWRGCP